MERKKVPQQTSARRKVEGMFAVLRIREKELMQIKGPCGAEGCRLHNAHAGPCDIKKGKVNGGT